MILNYHISEISCDYFNNSNPIIKHERICPKIAKLIMFWRKLRLRAKLDKQDINLYV